MRWLANACARRIGDCIGMALAGYLLLVFSRNGGIDARVFSTAGSVMLATGCALSLAGLLGRRNR